jgi:hypothetical protein
MLHGTISKAIRFPDSSKEILAMPPKLRQASY